MKPTSDEPIDRLVRQALEKGADAPVPSFDAARVWGNLSQELKQPEKQRLAWGRWAVAACVIGALTFFWLMQPEREKPTAAITQPSRLQAVRSKQVVPKQESIAVREPIAVRTKQSPNALATNSSEKIPARNAEVVVAPAYQPIASAAEMAVPETLSTEQPAQEAIAAVASPRKSAARKRFRVMHVNEWQVEEETKPKLYRTQGLVRLGTINDPAESGNATKNLAPPLILFKHTKSN
ncbi:hypothetical protein [Tellurirhabdus bombi]|uniref:hypothetical protein n=1 Tax=Tellurirhabdus bombi TaxID=2907205 RepID=UPI001F367CA6|nr:hypothetical protein [Tellurirhabdus bombi]